MTGACFSAVSGGVETSKMGAVLDHTRHVVYGKQGQRVRAEAAGYRRHGHAMWDAWRGKAARGDGGALL